MVPSLSRVALAGLIVACTGSPDPIDEGTDSDTDTDTDSETDTDTDTDTDVDTDSEWPPCIDRFEPNDREGQATRIEPGVLEGLRLCGYDDVDEFVVELPETTFPAGWTVTAAVTGEDLVHVGIGRPQAAFLDRNHSWGSTASVSMTAVNEPVRVSMFRESQDPAEYHLYSLAVTAEPLACAAERFEPQDEHKYDGPTVGAGLIEQVSLCGEEIDFFRVKIPPESSLRATLRYNIEDGAPSFEVWEILYGHGTQFRRSDYVEPATGEDQLTIDYSVEADSYVFVIRGQDPDAIVAYSLEIEDVGR